MFWEEEGLEPPEGLELLDGFELFADGLELLSEEEAPDDSSDALFSGEATGVSGSSGSDGSEGSDSSLLSEEEASVSSSLLSSSCQGAGSEFPAGREVSGEAPPVAPQPLMRNVTVKSKTIKRFRFFKERHLLFMVRSYGLIIARQRTK